MGLWFAVGGSGLPRRLATASYIAFVRGHLKLEHGTIAVNWNRTDREARGSPLEPYFKALLDQDVRVQR